MAEVDLTLSNVSADSYMVKGETVRLPLPVRLNQYNILRPRIYKLVHGLIVVGQCSTTALKCCLRRASGPTITEYPINVGLWICSVENKKCFWPHLAPHLISWHFHASSCPDSAVYSSLMLNNQPAGAANSTCPRLALRYFLSTKSRTSALSVLKSPSQLDVVLQRKQRKQVLCP